MRVCIPGLCFVISAVQRRGLWFKELKFTANKISECPPSDSVAKSVDYSMAGQPSDLTN